jgi:hypothetical protein
MSNSIIPFALCTLIVTLESTKDILILYKQHYVIHIAILVLFHLINVWLIFNGVLPCDSRFYDSIICIEHQIIGYIQYEVLFQDYKFLQSDTKDVLSLFISDMHMVTQTN